MTILRWITLALWGFWLIAYWNGGLRTASDLRKALAARMYADALAIGVIAAATIVLLAAGAALAAGMAAAGPQGGWGAALAGAALSGAGVAGTFYARRCLGRFWTADTALQAGHHVVDTGPYAVVRHPIYTAAVVLYAGGALAFPLWPACLASLAAAIGYVGKTALEDQYLTRCLAGYGEYCKTVRYRLVPGVW